MSASAFCPLCNRKVAAIPSINPWRNTKDQEIVAALLDLASHLKLAHQFEAVWAA